MSDLYAKAVEDGVTTQVEYSFWLSGYARCKQEVADELTRSNARCKQEVVDELTRSNDKVIPDYMNDAIAEMVKQYPTHGKE